MNDSENNQARAVPRAAALHDLSCFGRCALTVIAPTLSSMGVQCVPIPTALLSTHTGGFNDMYFCELDGAIPRIADHFEDLGLKFDAVYTGFLGSARQVDIIEDFICRFGSDNGNGGVPLVLVDPVLGDEGEFYHTCTPELAAAMRRLCVHADVITPNLTEACLMVGDDYSRAVSRAAEDAAALCRELAAKIFKAVGGKRLRGVVITGIPTADGGVMTSASEYNNADGAVPETYFTSQPRVARDYPGTGDIFASYLLGSLLGGKTLAASAEAASRFAAKCAARTLASAPDEPTRNGVALEAVLAEERYSK